jgi:hypothetical protein
VPVLLPGGRPYMRKNRQRTPAAGNDHIHDVKYRPGRATISSDRDFRSAGLK